ncbi:hypothetical protein T02_9364 [Trichinella nativa]|uniref:PiggyBac transposable element-derived protein domain-containing protein n=1 Tax=Trichinella nativa TaxID=6335 RepID=A0A0V1L0T4_9BILA|nr:hypothetical protein T02_9364 [Trichinella nativa]
METQIEQLRLGHAASGDLRRANDVYAENEECAEQYRNGYISSGKYRVKINWICDAENGYALKAWLTAIDAVFAHRRDVLACSRKAARRDPYSTLIVYEYNKKVTMISYVPRKNSNVLLLTSCHAKLKVNNQQGFKRPDIITYYNLGNGGLDSLDARIEDFCCKKDQQIHRADVDIDSGGREVGSQ